MNFTALVIHGLSALSVFSHIIGVRLLVAGGTLMFVAFAALAIACLAGGPGRRDAQLGCRNAQLAAGDACASGHPRRGVRALGAFESPGHDVHSQTRLSGFHRVGEAYQPAVVGYNRAMQGSRMQSRPGNGSHRDFAAGQCDRAFGVG